MLLITGSTGHTGTHFIEKLKGLNFKGRIRCAVRPESDLSTLKASGLDIDYRVGVLEDYAFVDSCMKGVTRVIHIAGIHWSENITKAALANRVGWVVYVHTTGRFSKFKSAAQDYARIEEAAIASGVPYTILRPTMIYGSQRDKNIQKLIEYIDTHAVFPIFGRGQNLLQPVHARDLAEAVVQAYLCREKTSGKCYNIPGKAAITYEQLLRTISEGLGKKTVFLKIPYRVSLIAARIYNAATGSALISVEQVMRMNEDRNFSYEQAARDLNYRPISFEEGVSEQIAEYQRARENRT